MIDNLLRCCVMLVSLFVLAILVFPTGDATSREETKNVDVSQEVKFKFRSAYQSRSSPLPKYEVDMSYLGNPLCDVLRIVLNRADGTPGSLYLDPIFLKWNDVDWSGMRPDGRELPSSWDSPNYRWYLPRLDNHFPKFDWINLPNADTGLSTIFVRRWARVTGGHTVDYVGSDFRYVLHRAWRHTDYQGRMMGEPDWNVMVDPDIREMMQYEIFPIKYVIDYLVGSDQFTSEIGDYSEKLVDKNYLSRKNFFGGRAGDYEFELLFYDGNFFALIRKPANEVIIVVRFYNETDWREICHLSASLS